MKKIFIAIIISTFAPISLIAGEHSAHIGINGSMLNNADAKAMPGFSFGYAHEWNINDKWAIQVGLGYLKRGIRLEDKVIYTFDSEWATLNDINILVGYIGLDISIKRFLTDKNKMFLSIGANPYLAIHDRSTFQILKWWNKWDYYPDRKFPPVNVDYGSSYEYSHLAVMESSVIILTVEFGKRFTYFSLLSQIRYDILGGLGPVGPIVPPHYKFTTLTIDLSIPFSQFFR